MDVKETIKKIKDTVTSSETYDQVTQAINSVTDIANKIKAEGLQDTVTDIINDSNLKKDEYYDIKKAILDKIKAYNTIIIHRHVSPDGDAFGSAYGLREMLRTSFPEKKVLAVGSDTVEYLKFMGEDDQVTEEDYKDALVIILDTADSKRISGKLYNTGKETIKIDHHLRVEDYANLNYVREEMPATAIVLIDFYNTFPKELKISSQGAMFLYLGTVTDTGRFRYSSVNGQTLRLAGTMLDKGFDTERMYANLNLKEKESMKLTGYVLNNFKMTENGVCYIYLSKRIQKKFKVGTEEATAQVNVMDSVKGGLIWILFVEFDNIIRVRLRSRFIGVNDIARQFNGGGHMQASGASVKNKKEMKKMIDMADEALKIYKEEHKDVK